MSTVENVEFSMELESGNEAIIADPRYAIAKILRDVAKMIENGRDEAAVKDVNGNSIGKFYLHIEETFDDEDDEDDDNSEEE